MARVGQEKAEREDSEWTGGNEWEAEMEEE